MHRTSHDRVRSTRIAKLSGSVASLQPITVSHLGGRIVERDWTNGIVRRVGAKGHLFMEGDAKTHIYKVASGAVCLYKVLADGRRQIIEFALEEDVIGLGSAPVETCNAQAIVSTRLKCLPLAVLLKAALRLYEALSPASLSQRVNIF